MFKRILVGLVVVIGAIYLWNASWLAPAPTGDIRLIAHRGMHQNFDLALWGDLTTWHHAVPIVALQIERKRIQRRRRRNPVWKKRKPCPIHPRELRLSLRQSA